MIIRIDDNTDERYRQLTKRLDSELKIRDGEEHNFYAEFNNSDQIHHIVLYEKNGHYVACGALKSLDQYTVEIKRMYTTEAYRRQGIAAHILAELERWAEEMGFIRSILETGMRQQAAILFYGKHGYNQIENYGQYVGVENSVCFEKSM